MEDQRIGDDPSNGVVKSVHYEMSVEELVAKAIAPVKKEFRRPPPIRTSDNNDNTNADSDGGKAEKDGGVFAPVIKEKKSKRQQKRERQQVQKSFPHLCPMVAKSGNISSCQYSVNCRYSHDMEAYKLLKPDDLEGICPFFDEEGPCPYGLTCRYGSTHKNYSGAEMVNALRKSSEINGLKKDVQKLLWKNKMKFPKADDALKLLGLQGPHAKNKKLADNEDVSLTPSNGPEDVDGNGCSKLTADSSNEVVFPTEVVVEGKPGEADVTDDLRLPKKPKCSIDETVIEETTNADQMLVVNDVDRSADQNEPEPIVAHIMEDTKKSLKLHAREKKLIDFREKLYLAPLTTVGNLPFRRVCKVLGADVTCGEMAMCTNLLQGQASEWALLRRHSSEDFFGVQICGAFPDTVAKTVELIEQNCTVDFIDINMGCPIDLVCNKGGGSALLTKPMRMKNVIDASSRAVDIPLTIKVRTGYYEGKNRIDSLIADMGSWGATAVTVHGRTRQQRYTKLADWDYIYKCARAAPSRLQVIGNGDMFSYVDWNSHKSDCPELSSCMIARGALVKPWIFTEIKEQRHWDISSGERLDILKDYVRFGLQHWGSDSKGVETTRHFLLEWLSYTCRYIPIGITEVIPKINWRPPAYYGRDDLETLMASESAADWIKISELLLGKVPSGFTFAPKHKTNAYYDKAENG